jgi:hypothetical protein
LSGENSAYPVLLSTTDSKLIDKEKRRINHALSNCFAGTAYDKPIGELDLGPKGAVDVDKETSELYTKLNNTALVPMIML